MPPSVGNLAGKWELIKTLDNQGHYRSAGMEMNIESNPPLEVAIDGHQCTGVSYNESTGDITFVDGSSSYVGKCSVVTGPNGNTIVSQGMWTDAYSNSFPWHATQKPD